jgi:hypothetical protein
MFGMAVGCLTDDVIPQKSWPVSDLQVQQQSEPVRRSVPAGRQRDPL